VRLQVDESDNENNHHDHDTDDDDDDNCVCTPKYSIKTLSITTQEAQPMLTNPHDAFTGQSRSPNMVPFDMVSY